jgi:selenophosphate synthetase-related protein
MMAVDMRGAFRDPYPFWNASVDAPPMRLRGDLELLPSIAESGLCRAAKDISMAGALGTAMMLLECSEAGATIDLDRIPMPPGVPELRWLSAFPSFGFVLSVAQENVDEVARLFTERDLACAAIGHVNASKQVMLQRGGDSAVLWDFDRQAFIKNPNHT